MVSGDTEPGQPADDIGTWSIEQLTAHTARLGPGHGPEFVRVLSQNHVYYDNDRGARLRWAKLSLYANRRAHRETPSDLQRMLQQNFMLRTWVIVHLGAEEGDPDWDPEVLAADTLAALTLEPAQFATLWASRGAIANEQRRDLVRHESLTMHIDGLIGYLRPGPSRDRLAAWCEVFPPSIGRFKALTQ